MDIEQDKCEFYSYGRRNCQKRTRFLLIRTSSNDGKQTFKRITFPGNGTVESLKSVIEIAMKKGQVLDVVTLPDRISIRTDDQIQNLSQSQKIEAFFDLDDENIQGRKYSLTQDIQARKLIGNNSSRFTKTISMNEEFINGTIEVEDSTFLSRTELETPSLAPQIKASDSNQGVEDSVVFCSECEKPDWELSTLNDVERPLRIYEFSNNEQHINGINCSASRLNDTSTEPKSATSISSILLNSNDTVSNESQIVETVNETKEKSNLLVVTEAISIYSDVYKLLTFGTGMVVIIGFIFHRYVKKDS